MKCTQSTNVAGQIATPALHGNHVNLIVYDSQQPHMYKSKCQSRATLKRSKSLLKGEIEYQALSNDEILTINSDAIQDVIIWDYNYNDNLQPTDSNTISFDELQSVRKYKSNINPISNKISFNSSCNVNANDSKENNQIYSDNDCWVSRDFNKNPTGEVKEMLLLHKLLVIVVHMNVIDIIAIFLGMI